MFYSYFIKLNISIIINRPIYYYNLSIALQRKAMNDKIVKILVPKSR